MEDHNLKNKERKQKEASFHNKLRLDKTEYLNDNKRFYSITKGSKEFVERWLLKNGRNKKVLDHCCGSGELSIYLAKHGAIVTGIDISEEGIKKAEQQNSNATFLVMDAENLTFEDNNFDIIVCNGVLHHLDITKAYIEMLRVLKPDGKIICNEPLIYNPIFQLYRRLTPYLRTEWEVNHILSRKEIELSKKYFDNVETKFFHLATLFAVPFRNTFIFNPLLKLLEKIDSVLLRLPVIKWFSWQIVFILYNPKKDA